MDMTPTMQVLLATVGLFLQAAVVVLAAWRLIDTAAEKRQAAAEKRQAAALAAAEERQAAALAAAEKRLTVTVKDAEVRLGERMDRMEARLAGGPLARPVPGGTEPSMRRRSRRARAQAAG